MVIGRPDDIILSPGKPTRPRRGFFGWMLSILGRRKREPLSLTVGPYQVGIIIWEGAVLDIFSEETQTLPEGDVQTYVVTTAPVKLTFRLKGPGGSSYPYDIVLDPPLLTSDAQHVAGRLDLTVSVIAQGSRFTSVIPEKADRLLQLLGLSGDVVTKSDLARMIKGELSPKLLALDLRGYTADELRSNRELLQGISGPLKVELASAIDRFGLQVDDFYINWSPSPEKTAQTRQPERDSRLEDPKPRRGSQTSAPAVLDSEPLQEPHFLAKREAGVAKLAEHGYRCVNQRGTEILASNHELDRPIRIQIKTRIGIYRKFLGNDTYMCFPIGGDWYLIPHDVLMEIVRDRTNWLNTESWNIQGVYHSASPSKFLIKGISEFAL